MRNFLCCVWFAALVSIVISPAVPAQSLSWALRFDGGVLSFPHHSVMNTGATITIEGWMRADPTATGYCLLSERYAAGTEHKHLVVHDDGRIAVIYAGTPWPDQATAPGVFPIGSPLFHHVAFVRHASGTYEIYLDGVAVLSAGPGPCGSTFPACAILNGSAPTRFGGGGTGWEVRSARTSTVDRYNGPFPPAPFWPSDASTAMLLQLAAGAGIVVTDIGPAGQNGLLSGQVTWVPLGAQPFNCALSQAPSLDLTVSLNNGQASAQCFLFYSNDPMNTTASGTGVLAGLHIAMNDVFWQLSAAFGGDPLFGGTLGGTGTYSATFPGIGFISSLSGQTWWCVGIQQVFGGSPQASNIASITLL